MAKQKKNTSKLNSKTLLISLIVIGGILATVYLVQKQTNLFSKASPLENDYQVQSLDGAPATYNVGYQVKSISYTLPDGKKKNLNFAIWYPTDATTQAFSYKMGKNSYDADVAVDGAPHTGTQFPLIVFSHGLFGCGTQSVYLTWYWASQGYVVAAPDHEDALTCTITKDSTSRIQRLKTVGNFFKMVGGILSLKKQDNTERESKLKPYFDKLQKGNTNTRFGRPQQPSSATNPIATFASDHRPLDVKAVIDEMLRLNGDSASPFYQTMNADEVAVSGHSLGGWTTSLVLGGTNSLSSFTTNVADSRVKAGVMLAPAITYGTTPASMTSVKIPTMFQYGSADTLVPASSAAYDTANDPKYYAILDGATHFTFDDSSCFDYGNVKDCGDQDALTNSVRTYTTAFFNKYLKNNTSADTTLLQTPPQFTTYEHQP